MSIEQHDLDVVTVSTRQFPGPIKPKKSGIELSDMNKFVTNTVTHFGGVMSILVAFFKEKETMQAVEAGSVSTVTQLGLFGEHKKIINHAAVFDRLLPHPNTWSVEVREMFTTNTLDSLLEETLDILRQGRTSDKVARGKEFKLALGWVLGYWTGAVSFARVCNCFGLSHKRVIEGLFPEFEAHAAKLRTELCGTSELELGG